MPAHSSQEVVVSLRFKLGLVVFRIFQMVRPGPSQQLSRVCVLRGASSCRRGAEGPLEAGHLLGDVISGGDGGGFWGGVGVGVRHGGVGGAEGAG